MEKRQRLGKAVAVAGLTASITLTSAGCVDFGTTAGDMLPGPEVEMGGVMMPPELTGETEFVTLMGDMPLEREVSVGELTVPWIEGIALLGEDEAKDRLCGFSREMIKAEWSVFYTTPFEGEESQDSVYVGDSYLTDDGTLIKVQFDETEMVVGVKITPNFQNE